MRIFLRRSGFGYVTSYGARKTASRSRPALLFSDIGMGHLIPLTHLQATYTSSRFSLYYPIRERNRRPRFPFRPFHPIYSILTSSLFSSSFFFSLFVTFLYFLCFFSRPVPLVRLCLVFVWSVYPRVYFVDRVVRLTLRSRSRVPPIHRAAERSLILVAVENTRSTGELCDDQSISVRGHTWSTGCPEYSFTWTHSQ